MFKNTILDYVKTQLDGEFAYEILDLCMQETNPSDNFNLANLVIKLNGNQERLFDESFTQSLDAYIDLDLNYPPSTFNPNFISIKIYLDYRRLRQLNPEWKKSKCLWYASKEIIHLSLDAFGLIPVGGEIADLINGVLYTIEGDGLNATLSFGSAIPIAGWASTGVRYSLKVVNQATDINNKIKLVWKVLPNNVIYFGSDSYCRTQLRKVLGMVAGNANQAHHIIPLNLQTHEVVQRAAKSGNAFHMNEALNGISLSTAVHSGSHGNYDSLIATKLNDFITMNPNASPKDCYIKIKEIIQEIRLAIQNNPGVRINQLNF